MKLDARVVSSLSLSRSDLRQISALSTSEKLRIARALRDLDDKLSLRLGSVLIKDPDPRVRAEVTIGLGEIGYRVMSSAVEPLASRTLVYLGQLARDPEWQVRVNVPFAALQYGGGAVLPIVHGLLDDSAPRVREAALNCYQDLAALHPNTAAKLMIEPMDPMTIVGAAATPSLGRFWAPHRGAVRPSRAASIGIHVPVLGVTAREANSSAASTGAAFTQQGSGAASTSPGPPLDDAPPGARPGDGRPPAGGGGGGEGGGGGGEGQTPGGGPPGDEPEYLDIGGGSRHVNSWFVGHPNPLQPLEFGREYELGIEVAPQLRVGTFTRGDPRFREPEFGGEETLEVTVGIVSDDFTIPSKAARRMTLPRDPSKRSSGVSFKVTPVKNNQDVFIHLFFYHQNNLFHESLIGAHVQVLRPQPGETATAPLNPVTRFHAPLQGPRDVNLQVTELRGSYRLVLFYDFGGADFDILSCTVRVNRDKIVDLLKGVRDDLESVVNTQGKLANGNRGKIFFDGEPPQMPQLEGRLPNLLRIDDEAYQGALTLLARAGSKLYVNLFESTGASKEAAAQASLFGQKLRALSAKQPLNIQVLSDEFFIPWNLLFDGPFPAPRIDPDQFWGFRHTIEEVPGSSRDERIEPLIQVTDRPLPVALNLNVNGIPRVLTDPQRSSFQNWKPGLDPVERFTEDEVLAALQGQGGQGEVEYFYCHAGVAGTSEAYFDQSYLGLTSDKRGLTLEDIKIATVGRVFTGRPVVFLNACESARMDGRFYDGFVPRFLAMGARVVVGTDCEVPSLVGAHFGTRFLEAFFQGRSVGEAVVAQRRELLARYQNPLGLIYRVFGNGDTKLSRPLI